MPPLATPLIRYKAKAKAKLMKALHDGKVKAKATGWAARPRSRTLVSRTRTQPKAVICKLK